MDDYETKSFIMGRRLQKIKTITEIIEMLSNTYEYSTTEKQELLIDLLKAQVDTLTKMYPPRQIVNNQKGKHK